MLASIHDIAIASVATIGVVTGILAVVLVIGIFMRE